ncbi:capsular polysaccharide synthesis protein [Thioclava sp. FTW29]|uniref:Capsular polysaccharide synthesis protein n=1 Tax=Thioclava litoralis TaxID=3076557 RepID=A0ABZ1E3I4_9RHOB|nr:capsular polysaccharide synthesis protein [Thioclava sp. FTW29]
MPLPSCLSKALKSARFTAKWLRSELPYAPGLELYARHIDRHNRHLTAQMMFNAPEATPAYYAPYRGRAIPKIIWMYWAQGIEAAPPVVQRCIAQWRAMNPGWDLRVLTRETVGEWVDLSDIDDSLAFRLHANALRLRLLARYGGLWADVTTYCHRPLDEWMPLLGGQTGFFTFGGPYHDRWVDNWFIAAHPENPLIQRWCADYDAYVTRLRHTPRKYFMMIYTFQWAMIRNAKLRHAFRAAGSLPAVPAYYLMAALEGNATLDPFLAAQECGFPVSKLSHRSSLDPQGLVDRLEALLAEAQPVLAAPRSALPAQ